MKNSTQRTWLLSALMVIANISTFATQFVSDGIRYNILSEEEQTVEVIGTLTTDAPYAGTIEIPASVSHDGTTYAVTAIGYSAFFSCDGVTEVTIPNSVTTIGSYAFAYCGSMTEVTIGNSVTYIWGSAFNECESLTSVTIPNSVTTIGSEAFAYCESMKTVTIGNSVSSIGDYAFDSCESLTDITVDEDNEKYRSIDGVLYDKDATVLIVCPIKKESVAIPNSVTTIGEKAFHKCSVMTEVTIPNSVITIEEDAFARCTMASITIGNSVTTIGAHAFLECEGLTEVTIPNSVRDIKYSTFEMCRNLKTVTIGSSVGIIEEYAFFGCDVLTSICCLASDPPTASSQTFSETVQNNGTLYVMQGCKTAYEGAEVWSDFRNIEELNYSGIDTASTGAADMQLTTENGTISVSGIGDEEHIMVYDAHSRLIYSGTERKITNLPRGIYIVKAGTSTAKAAL